MHNVAILTADTKRVVRVRGTQKRKHVRLRHFQKDVQLASKRGRRKRDCVNDSKWEVVSVPASALLSGGAPRALGGN